MALRRCGGGELTGLLQVPQPVPQPGSAGCVPAGRPQALGQMETEHSCFYAHAHLTVCLPVCLVFAPRSPSSGFQPVLRGSLTLGNWLILALCTSIRHRRVSKTLPSSASVVVGNNMSRFRTREQSAQNGGDLSLAVPRSTCSCVLLSLLSYEPRSCVLDSLHRSSHVDVKCKKESLAVVAERELLSPAIPHPMLS